MESNFIVRVRNQTENIHVTQVIWYSTLSECFVECYDSLQIETKSCGCFSRHEVL